MWHEARKQEKKIRGMMVDYKKRAERRREYYEKIKQDPAQFLQVHGRPCKIHLDPAVAQAADSPATMMPWQGHTDNMIDRFDVRAHLDIIPEYKPTDEAPKMSTAEMLEDRQSNYERYRALVQNDFLGVSEDKFLHQIYLEERYGPLVKPTSEEEKKKLADKKAAIGYVYEDSTPQGFTASAALSAVNNDDRDNDDDDDDKDDDLSDIDLDLAIEVDELTPSQCEEMNLQALAYGMKDDDFTKFLYQDKEEAEQLRLARELEEEKAMYSGRKSRRERRALREKKLQGRRITSPPSYAARESPTYKPFHRSHSSSRSRSHSPVNAGQITYITSFGDDGSEDEAAGPKGPPPKPASVKADKIPTVSLPPSAKHHVSASASSAHHHHRAVQQDTNATTATTKVSERTSRSSPPPTSSSRSQHHRSSRTRYRNQSSSDSRSSHSSYRDSSRRRKSSSSSYRHTRSRHRSRSRSTSSAGRSRSSTPRSDRSRSRSYRSYRHRRTRSKSRSRSRSDSRSRSRTPRSSKSRSRSHSWSKSRSQSERHHSHSHSPRLPTPPVRSYYRHSLSRSSSDLSSESEEDKNERSSTNTQSTQSASSTRPFPLLGKADPTAKKLTPQEKLKRKMQAALNRQYKADKRAQLQKIEKQQQEQQDRAEELREMAIKLRQRERERRHRMMEYDREHPSSYSSRQGRTEFSASGARDVDERSSRRPRHQSYERRRSSRSRSKSANSTSTSSDSRSRSRSRSRDRGRSRTPPSRRRHSDHRDHRRWGHRSRSRSRNRNGGRLVMGY